MAARRVVPVGLLCFAGGVSAPAAVPQVVEKWRCEIDLHQGDRGTLAFEHQTGKVEGRIVLERSGTSFTHRIEGEWVESEIRFTRVLSPTSSQPFRGRVTASGTGMVTMEGRFAAGEAGLWSAECRQLRAGGTQAEPAGDQPQPDRGGRARREPPRADVGLLRPPIVERGPDLILDLLAAAPKAKWTNAWKALPFPGEPNDASGFARILDNAELEDGRRYPRVIETHPQWQPHGLVTGRFAAVAIPAAGAELSATLGFLAGAQASDGVYFEVRGEFPAYHGVPIRREYHKRYDGHPAEGFRQNLSRFAGGSGTLILSVSAGDRSAAQDRAVWVAPQLRPLGREPRFASFVGGAVGSRRDGDRLLNPWGEFLYGDVMLYLRFADVDREYSLRLDSYCDGQAAGTTPLPAIRAGQTEAWIPLTRTRKGRWRERVIFNGGYEGEIPYVISRM